jgi:hypothetical protein
MTFDGCHPVLGCTILLSGPNQQKNELTIVKKVLKKLMTISRQIIFEKNFLQMLEIEVA